MALMWLFDHAGCCCPPNGLKISQRTNPNTVIQPPQGNTSAESTGIQYHQWAGLLSRKDEIGLDTVEVSLVVVSAYDHVPKNESLISILELLFQVLGWRWFTFRLHKLRLLFLFKAQRGAEARTSYA